MYTQYYTSSPISAEYSSTNNNISIIWGGVHDQKDYYVSPIFYISFYGMKKTQFLKNSICSAFTSYYNETKLSNSTVWSNVENLKFKFEITAVGTT